jgi:mRNA-degrading endonuclease toxin of MazEF toxin-antitoxin module
MARLQPGEVWMVDLGLAAKVRPCLILSEPPADDELALVIIIPHTTAIRGNRWELAIPNPSCGLVCFIYSKSNPFPSRVWKENWDR